MTGSHVTNYIKQIGDPSSENLSNKEAAADALAALDVVSIWRFFFYSFAGR
jgi:hypothetical protein